MLQRGWQSTKLGGIYIAEHHDHRIRFVTPDGIITTIAGMGPSGGFSGDGGPANLALVSRPFGLSLGPSGNLYFAESGNRRIRMIDGNGVITTITTITGSHGLEWDVVATGDGRLIVATNTRIIEISPGEPPKPLLSDLNRVRGLALDKNGNIYFAETGRNLVRKLDRNGTVTTVAGGGTETIGVEGLAADQVRLFEPFDVEVDSDGNVFIAEFTPGAIRQVTPDGRIYTVAGGPNATATIGQPKGIEFDAEGNLYIVDTPGGRVRRLSPDGQLRTVAGSGGYNGDGRQAVWSLIARPNGLAFDALGRLYIADAFNNRIRRVNLDGTIETVAGDGEIGFRGDGGPALAASLSGPKGVAVGTDRTVYISDTGNHRVRKVTQDGYIDSIAGGGSDYFTDSPIPALEVGITGPTGLAVLSDGTVYVTDTGNHRVRRINPDGMISTAAGSGEPGFDGDGGSATAAKLLNPTSVTVGDDGALIICDQSAHVVRRVSPEGFISTLAGNGKPGKLEGDGGPATAASLGAPSAAVSDSVGNIFIADFGNNVIRKVDKDGIIRSLQVASPARPSPRRFTGRVSGLAVATDGSVYYSISTQVNRLVPSESMLFDPLPEVLTTGVVNAASSTFGPVAPGMIFSIFGLNLGPPVARGAEVSADGFLPTSLADCRVLFDGIPAPILFTSRNQTNGVAPFSLLSG